MNRFIFSLVIFLSIIISNHTFAQDYADGFASVSGKGLITTTGGAGGETVYVETISDLQSHASSSEPYIIIVKGTLASENFTTVNINSNKTIVGYGIDANLKNIELHMENKENIIIRNLTVSDSYVDGDYEGKENDNDGVQADNCHHLWIDHCHFTNLGDGLIDLRHNTDYVTVSNTKLSDHNKAFGIGWTDSTNFHITIHHCWIDSTNQRNPSFGNGVGHLYNNYLRSVYSYGNLSRDSARVIVQNSYFFLVKDPVSISGEGSLLYSENNIFSLCSGNMVGNIDSMMYDPSDYYNFQLDPVEDVKDIVSAEAGPKLYVSDQYTGESTAVDDLLSKDQVNTIRYYVDPMEKMLRINTENGIGEVRVKVYNYDAKLLKTKNINLRFDSQVSLNSLDTGIYIVHFEFLDKMEVGKIYLN